MNLKKPKFWDFKKPNLIAYILLPFAFLLQNLNNILRRNNPYKFKIKTVCVGNIYIGGTGKTPTTIKLYEILKKLNFKVSTAKKFYKSQVDENLILEKKTSFISGLSRKEIIKKAIKNKQNLIIFDDGLQDRSVFYDLKFVCFDAEKFIGNGLLIPSGPLRENLNSLNKYDCVFLKSNNKINNDNLDLIKKNNNKIKIFETYLKIENLKSFDLTKEYLIFSGIGNHESFKEILIDNQFNIKNEIIFPDHHNYKDHELKKIIEKAKISKLKIITTEKDYVKISKTLANDINFIDVKTYIKDEEKLTNFIKKKLNV